MDYGGYATSILSGKRWEKIDIRTKKTKKCRENYLSIYNFIFSQENETIFHLK
jgi:hypothetical protein